MLQKKCCILITIILVILFSSKVAQAKTISIDTCDNARVSDVTVMIYGKTNGQFTLLCSLQSPSGETVPLDIPEKDICVVADHPSYAPFVQEYKAAANTIHMRLKQGKQLAIEVHDYLGQPVPDVLCALRTTVQPFGYIFCRKGHTNTEGVAAVKAVAAAISAEHCSIGNELQLGKQGYYGLTATVDLEKDVCAYELNEKNAIFGRLTDSYGDPCGRININLKEVDSDKVRNMMTNTDGKFIYKLDDVQASKTYFIRISNQANFGVIKEKTLDNVVVAKEPYIIAVEYTFGVRGKVVNTFYEPVEEFYVALGALYKDEISPYNLIYYNNPEGKFSIGLWDCYIHEEYDYFVEIYSKKHGKYYMVANLENTLNDLGEIQLIPATGIKGRVIDHEEETPIEDVEICVMDERNTGNRRINKYKKICYISDKTGSDGTFCIENVGKSRHKLLFEKQGYAPVLTDSLYVKKNKDLDIGTIEMSTGNSVAGEIKTKHIDEDAIDYTSLRLVVDEGPGIFDFQFPEIPIQDKAFSITHLAKGRYRLKLYYGDKRLYKYVTFADHCCDTEKVVFTIGGTHVFGYIFLEGEPVPGVDVEFSQGAGPTVPENPEERPYYSMDPVLHNREVYGVEKGNTYVCISDPDGKYSLECVEPGIYTILLNKGREGYALPSKEIMVQDMANMRHDIHIKGASLKLYVHNEDNEPVARPVIVRPHNEQDRSQYLYGSSDQAGNALFVLKSLGVYAIKVVCGRLYESAKIEDVAVDAYEQEYYFEVCLKRRDEAR